MSAGAGSGADRAEALLVTADGTVFAGEAAGAAVPVATGELVFNTAMSGYQEVITDPSYAGQVIAFTSTHIGNYGTNAADDEAALPHCRGVVVCDLAAEPSNWRATEGLEPFLRRHGVPALTGVDTRRLARHVREAGAVPCAFGTAPEAELRAAAASAVGTDGLDLVSGVTTTEPSVHPGTAAGAASGLRIVAYDFGVKATMVDLLTTLGTVTVVPAGTTADEVLALEPDGVFLSNGPGDPAALPGPDRRRGRPRGARPHLRHLPRPPDPGHRARGHDLQAALRAPRRQPPRAAPRDRRGGDHQPEPQLRRGRRLRPRRRDDPRQPQRRRDRGLALASPRRRSRVQYHPEAAPGPHDARYLFGAFRDLMLARPARAGTR